MLDESAYAQVRAVPHVNSREAVEQAVLSFLNSYPAMSEADAERRADLLSEDVVFEDQGVKVVVNRESLPYLDGTQVDYVRQGLNESFKFHNPNVKDECGCGESFTV